MSRAGLVRAEGEIVTTASSTDKIVIQKLDSNSGQFEPREITVGNLLTGGGTSFTAGSVIFAGSSGDFDQDNTNFFFNDSTNTLRITNIDAGVSGTAGTLDIFPSTASKGKLAFAAADSAGDTTTTITNASQAAARTYTIPDAGGAANFVLTSSADGTEAANAVTASGFAGVITTSALTTAASASYAITWTNTKIAATSKVMISPAGGTNTRVNFNWSVVSGAGSATLTLYNTEPANALNGTIILNYWVIP